VGRVKCVLLLVPGFLHISDIPFTLPLVLGTIFEKGAKLSCISVCILDSCM